MKGNVGANVSHAKRDSHREREGRYHTLLNKGMVLNHSWEFHPHKLITSYQAIPPTLGLCFNKRSEGDKYPNHITYVCLYICIPELCEWIAFYYKCIINYINVFIINNIRYIIMYLHVIIFAMIHGDHIKVYFKYYAYYLFKHSKFYRQFSSLISVIQL